MVGSPSGFESSSVDPALWLPLAVAAAVLLGVFLPLLSFSGDGIALIDGDWAATAAIVSALLIGAGGIIARRSSLGSALAAGASVTFLGLFAIMAREVLGSVDLADEFGFGADLGVGLYVWSLAALGAVAVTVIGVRTVGGEPTAPWAPLAAAGGVAVFWVGLLLPPDGFDFGDNLFGGDTWYDLAVVVLLAGLPAACVLLVTLRSAGAGAFCLGVSGAWAASWLVFAIDTTSGGLFVPFPDLSVLAALAVVLMSLSAFGAFWWAAPSSGTASFGSFGATTLVGGQLASVLICAGTAVAALGGVVSGGDGGFVTPQFATGAASFGTGSSASSDEPIYDEGIDEGFDDYGVEDFSDEDYSDDYSIPDDGLDDSGFGDDTEFTQCIEVLCQPPAETWVVSLGSYFSESEALAAYPTLPASGVLHTNQYASLNPDIWMVYYDGGYTSGTEAVGYCFDIGRTDRNSCYARRLSDDTGLDPNDPSLIVYPD